MDLILHEYYLPALANLSDSQFRKMVLAMLEYAKTGTVPEFDDVGLNFGFEMLRNRIENERKRYEARVEANRRNGSKGGRPRKNPPEIETQEKPSVILETQNNPTKPTETQSNPENPNISISINRNIISSSCSSSDDEKSEKKPSVFDEEWERVKRDDMWRAEVCMTHQIAMSDLDKIIERFESEIRIKGIHVDNMRRYFGSWVGPNRNILNERKLKIKQDGSTSKNNFKSSRAEGEFDFWRKKS